MAFWLRRGLGSDIRACACNGIRSRGGLSLARRSLTRSDAVARQGRCRVSARRRHQEHARSLEEVRLWLWRSLEAAFSRRGSRTPGDGAGRSRATHQPVRRAWLPAAAVPALAAFGLRVLRHRHARAQEDDARPATRFRCSQWGRENPLRNGFSLVTSLAALAAAQGHRRLVEADSDSGGARAEVEGLVHDDVRAVATGQVEGVG